MRRQTSHHARLSLWGAVVTALAITACAAPPQNGPGHTNYMQGQGNAMPGAYNPAAYQPGMIQAPATGAMPVYAPPQSMTAAVPAYAYAQPAPMPMPVSDSPMYAASKAPSIRAASYILIDASTGRTLIERNADTRRAVASTQKLLTALVVLDAGNLDKQVTVAASDVNVEPTRVGVRPGEVYTRRNLLYAFLIKSANDIANVLARDNAGSTAAFAAKMTAKARSLGAMNSNFRNAHGLTVSGQYSTARDMARIAMAAYRNPVIRDAVKRRYYVFRHPNGQTVTLKSTNDLLARMPECNGMKTGYTNASGRCLVSSAYRSGRDVILVQLGTQTKYIWDDGKILMSWGLDHVRRGGGIAMAE